MLVDESKLTTSLPLFQTQFHPKVVPVSYRIDWNYAGLIVPFMSMAIEVCARYLTIEELVVYNYC